MKLTMLVVIAVPLSLTAGCNDKAKPAYERCLALEAEGKLQEALDACNEAASADPESKSGQAAQSKKPDLGTRILDAQVQDEKKQKEAATQAEVAACKSNTWTTFCTVNGRPSGGLMKPGSKAKCEENATGFRSMGMQCAPCRCADDVVGSVP